MAGIISHMCVSGNIGKRKGNGRLFFCLFLFYIFVFVLSFSLGRFPISPPDLIRILLSRIFPIEKTWSDMMESVVFNIRLPRILAASMIGAGLSLSGLVFQIIFRNPMVSPDVLGTSTGAGFGAALALYMSFSGFGVTATAFLMGLLAVLIVWIISSRVPGNQVLGLVLGGIMISSIFQSGTSFIKLVADPDNQLPAITYFLMGSLAGIEMDDLRLIFLPMTLSAIPLLAISWHINILSLSEEEALSLGVNTKLIRAVAVVTASLMTASAVAVSGLIGWVGLVIPHITRMITGPDSSRSMPSSIFIGASFLIIVDTSSRNLTTSEVPIGILTSFIGAPFFLYLILREGRKR